MPLAIAAEAGIASSILLSGSVDIETSGAASLHPSLAAAGAMKFALSPHPLVSTGLGSPQSKAVELASAATEPAPVPEFL